MSAGVVTARATDTIRSVVSKMLSRHCGVIPIIDDYGTLLGLVAVRDVLIPLYPNYGDYVHDNVHSRDFEEMEESYPDVMRKPVGDIMTKNPLTVSPRDPILQAASYMGLKHFRRIPVEENGKLVGIISMGDVNRGLFFSQGRNA